MSATELDRIIKLPEVQKLTAKSRSSIYQGVKDGTFPNSIRLGSRSVGWKLSQITSWIDHQESISGNSCNT